MKTEHEDLITKCEGRFSTLETKFGSIASSLLKIENKIETLIENSADKQDVQDIKDELDGHKERIQSLETWRTWIFGAAGLIVILYGMGIFNHILKNVIPN